MTSSRRKPLEAQPKTMRIRPLSRPPRLQDRCSVKSLEALAEHWTVRFLEQSPGDVNDAVGVDPHEISVVRQVMDRTQRQAIHHGSDALRLRVLHDVRSLHELGLSERTNRASVSVGAQDVSAKALLVQALSNLP